MRSGRSRKPQFISLSRRQRNQSSAKMSHRNAPKRVDDLAVKESKTLNIWVD